MNTELHDLSTRRPRLRIRVGGSVVHESMLALWSALGGDDNSSSHEIGAKWFAGVRASIPDEVKSAMEGFGGDQGHVWAAITSLVAAADIDLADPEAVLGWLESSEFAGAKRTALHDLCWKADGDTVAAAAGGDDTALHRCLDSIEDPDKRAGYEAFFLYPAGRLGPEVASVLRTLSGSVFAEVEETWAAALAASTRAVRLQTGLDPVDLIERVTNGIRYTLPLGTTDLVLVPSVTIRPWTLVLEHGSTVVVVYPVADEHMVADPDAPPTWLVNYHRALGDERRMRMLRRIAQGEATLADLTKLLGLAKSTVFHHVGVLRGAGLVRVTLGGDAPVYTLRREAFPDARDVLDGYLDPHDTEGVGA